MTLCGSEMNSELFTKQGIMRNMTYPPRRARVSHPANKFRHIKNMLGILRSMVARTPPPASSHRPPPHPFRNIKGVKVKTAVTTTPLPFREEFLIPGVALATVDAFAKFTERGFTPKTIA